MSSDVPPAPKAVIAEGVMPLPASAPAMPAAPAPEPQAELPVESLLLRFRMITPAQLADAMKEEAVSGNSVASIVVEKGWVTAEAMAQIVPSPAAPAAAAASTPQPEPEPEPEPAAVPAEPALVAEPAPLFEAPAVETPRLEAPAPPAAPEPVASPMPEPVVEQPVVQPEPVVTATPTAPVIVEPEPEPVIAMPTPVAAPMPEPVFTPEPEPAAAAQPQIVFQILACLTNGERIEIARVRDAAEAKNAARDAMRSLKDESDWPCFSGRFVRPETVVSIDVAAHV